MRNKIIFFLLIFTIITFTSCNKEDNENITDTPESNSSNLEDPYPSDLKDRYIVFFLTNVSVEQADNINAPDGDQNYTFVSELPQYFGTIKEDSPYKYAFGLPGPMLLTQSIEEMKHQVNKAFDIAEKHNVPVYFQLDDCTNYTKAYGSGATPKYYENPEWCEWVSFPVGDEQWGGKSHGRLAYHWFNWGSWLNVEAFPCFESPGFRSFVINQMRFGFLEPLMTRYNKLISEGKEHLFAGVAVGWETKIPDNSSSNRAINRNNLPVSAQTGQQMELWEASKFGYNSLHLKGYDRYDMTVLDTVIHDYIKLLSKEAFDAGIPKEKIFSHIVGISRMSRSTNRPPFWTAVNDYCTPGFSYSATPQFNLDEILSHLKATDNPPEYWGNAESYTGGSNGLEKSFATANNYFDSMFGNRANLVAVFGWGRAKAGDPHKASHNKNSPFIKAANQWLNMKKTKE